MVVVFAEARLFHGGVTGIAGLIRFVVAVPMGDAEPKPLAANIMVVHLRIVDLSSNANPGRV
jgi:hypothetical protein